MCKQTAYICKQTADRCKKQLTFVKQTAYRCKQIWQNSIRRKKIAGYARKLRCRSEGESCIQGQDKVIDW